MRTAMSNETKETGSSFMEKLSTVIVDKRNLIFLLTIILLVFSAFSRNWVEVESDLTYYLPSDSETKQALDIMDEQFTTYGTAEVMVANITPEQAAALEPKIKEIKGVQSVDYDETTAHYNNLSALYSITFAYSEDDEACLDSLEAVKEYLSDYDLYVDTDLGNTQQETIDHEISVIMVYVAIVIVLVLSASMSTLSSLVLTSSSTLTLDLLQGNVVKKMSEQSKLGWMRALIVVFIIVSAALALVQYNSSITFIAQLMGISWGALAGAFLGPFLWGLYSGRISKAAVWCSFIVGVCLTSGNMVLTLMGTPLIASPINCGALAMLLSLIIVPVVSLFTKSVPFEVNPPSPEGAIDREYQHELAAERKGAE